MKLDWRNEVRKFRRWAEPQGKMGEWECNYEQWHLIYESVNEFLTTDISLWSQEEIDDLLYILARDWECGIIADELKAHSPDVVLLLAAKSLIESDWDARWQLADALGAFPSEARVEPLLLRFVNDEEEYVRRRALQSLARIGCRQTEHLAVREWEREDENQQWARMNALCCWQRIKSPLFEFYIARAEDASFPYLSKFARRLQNGEAACD